MRLLETKRFYSFQTFLISPTGHGQGVKAEADMRLLEVACGTGRLHTFIKVAPQRRPCTFAASRRQRIPVLATTARHPRERDLGAALVSAPLRIGES